MLRALLGFITVCRPVAIPTMVTLARVIIGTCNHPEKVRDLFIEELAGSVDDIRNKVIISNYSRIVL